MVDLRVLVLLLIRSWARPRCSLHVGLLCRSWHEGTMATPAESACSYVWSLALLTHLFVCLGTDWIEWSLASIRFGAEAAQHYNFAVGTHLLNAYCVLHPEWRLLRDIEETKMIMLLIPQGGKHINGAFCPPLWVSFTNVENKNVVKKG